MKLEGVLELERVLELELELELERVLERALERAPEQEKKALHPVHLSSTQGFDELHIGNKLDPVCPWLE